ncbi:MAG: hypothetical protein QM500_16375 [Methylococcales bacterium]
MNDTTKAEKVKVGRRKGSLGQSTIRKMAINILCKAIQDDATPIDAKVRAADSLLREIPR